MRDSTLDRRLLVGRILLFGAALPLIAVVHALSQLSDYARLGDSLPTWMPFVWEFSSVAVIAVLLPVLAIFQRRFPIDARSWRWATPLQIAATVPFSIVHVAGMVAIRKFVFAAVGSHYVFGAILPNWIYEYRKDFVTYWLLFGALSAFALYRARKEQNRIAHDHPSAGPNGEAEVVRRLVVRKLNREFILNTGEIDHIEASGNYVNVYAGGTSYRLRESLASLARRLDNRQFVQVHRGHIVNIDRIREIQPWDHGDYRILLNDGSFINFSRRYRSRLAHLFSPPVANGDAARP